MVIPEAVPATPAFVLEEESFKKNLEVISGLSEAVPARFLFALKGFSMHRVFPDIASVAQGAAVSSLCETKLANEYFREIHAYAPVYIPGDAPEIFSSCSHVTFNSLAEYHTYNGELQGALAGIRINPKYSAVTTDLYNPCVPGSRLGVPTEALPSLPSGITGLHVHNLCEGTAQDLAATLEQIEARFEHLLPNISWLNLGGGHLVTAKGYNLPLLKETLSSFHNRYPHIELMLEPGAAFVWETGVLIAQVLDIVENDSIATAMLDTSFAAHMPDCLEMPYTPNIRGAEIARKTSPSKNMYRYRMGGASCLAGDAAGDYLFPSPLKTGDRIVFEDMMHYTMVKTNMFNGIQLPDIGIWHRDGTYELVKAFSYADYRSRLS